MFAAILDTNVLLPSLQRDFLLSMAVEGLYRPLRSEAILEELRRHKARLRVRRGADPETAAVRADYLIEQMRENFDDALVTGWEGLEGTYGLPDPNDEHVVATPRSSASRSRSAACWRLSRRSPQGWCRRPT